MATRKTHRSGKRTGLSILVVVIICAYLYASIIRPLAPLQPENATTTLEPQTTASNLTWPSYGQSALAINGSSIDEVTGAQKPAPIASVAKIITALSILHEKPLTIGSQGPLVTMTAQDVAIYNNYVAQQGSVVAVQVGEQISEYQILEAMLLPSANNLADSAAIWAFGSLASYTTFAQHYVTELGLTSTHIGADASGFLPATTSTASDLIKLGELALAQPVLAQIVAESTATGIPVVGTVKNVNNLLGTDGIIGIKTGNTTQAGGVFLSADQTTINNRQVTIITSLVGAPTLWQAMKDSQTLILSAQKNFSNIPVVSAGAIVGSYKLPWGGTISATATKALIATTWDGTTIPATITLKSVSLNDKVGQIIGSVSVNQAPFGAKETLPLTLKHVPSKPSTYWRLLHPSL